MISWTRLVSRVASSCIRPAKRRTASGSSAASEHRLGEQRERADRGLELVADVGDEVAADRLDPAGLGEVLDEQQHQVGAERRHPGGDERSRRGRAGRGQLQLGLADLAVPADVRDQLAQLGGAPGRGRGPARRRTRPGWP